VGRFGDPEPLTPNHALEQFDCGRASLNQWLQRHALQAAAAGSARTYVTADSQQDRSYTRMLWTALRGKAAYLPG